MHPLKIAILPFVFLLLNGCAVQTPIIHQYKLDAGGTPPATKSKPRAVSLLVSPPEALAGYQTEQMLYVKKPFELSAFARNAWVSAPANMLFPMIIERMQNSGYFHAVASTPATSRADYRLDTQLIALQQNFLTQPSRIELQLNAVLTRAEDNQVIASHLFHQNVPCPEDTPYGGVQAANQAARLTTQALMNFTVQQIAQSHR